MAHVLCVLFYLKVLVYVFSHGANVLVLMGVPSPSHFIWIKPVINSLAEKGHNVTALSVNVDSNPPANVTYIHLENTYNVMYGNPNASNNIVKRSEDNPFQAVISAYNFGTLACKGCISSKGLRTLLSYPDDFRFDVIIYDCTAGPCILGFLQKFCYPPLISVSAFGIPQFSSLLVGGYKPSSHVPHFSLNYASPMNFAERATNFLVQNFDWMYRRWVFLPRIQVIAQPAFGFDLPFENMEHQSQIMLVNSNPLLDHAELLPQNVIPVGGLHIEEVKPLPQHIERFIETSRKGIILFAMGTNFKSKMFTTERQAMFVEAFTQLPEYHFLWKFDEDNMTIPLPSNLLISKWLPQSDVLAHPRVKAFITHCGLLSTYEATFHGVPILGIPIYIDQHKNAAQLVRNGAGLSLKLKDLSSDAIYKALCLVLENDTYRENMMKSSKLFRDQPEKPLDRAIWWIEWVLRHPHVYRSRSPTLDMNFIEDTNADVIVCMIFIVAVGLYIIWRLLKCCKIVTKSEVINANKKVL